MLSALALAAGSGARAADAPAGNATAEKPNVAPPVIPPRLSKPMAQYYADHPDEYRQLLARLSQRRLAPTSPVPANAAWQPLRRDAPVAGLNNPLLLTDGTVIVQQACTRNWYSLPGHQRRLRRQVLVPHRLDAGGLCAALFRLPGAERRPRHRRNGGEYNGAACDAVWTNRGAIYNPTTDSWSSVSPPKGWASIGDAQSVVLPNGTYMLANALTKQQALLNTSAMTWTSTGSGKFDENDEEGWTLLQDGTVFTADGYVDTGTCGKNTERYNPATGSWLDFGRSGGLAERVGDAVAERGAEFSHLGLSR